MVKQRLNQGYPQILSLHLRGKSDQLLSYTGQSLIHLYIKRNKQAGCQANRQA